MNADKIILYSDMDGTMLGKPGADIAVPEYNLRMLADFRAKGGLFSVASGRQYHNILSYFPEGTVNAPVVSANGSIVRDPADGKFIYTALLSTEFKRELCDYTRKRDDCVLLVSDLECLLVVDIEGKEKIQVDMVRKHISEKDFISGSIVKICCAMKSPSLMEEIVADYNAFSTASEVTYASSSPVFYEAVAAGVTKAGGIKKAVELFSAGDRTLVCIGDFYNDTEMLQLADIAACPGNSQREIKDICSIICRPNYEGAVGELIERLYEL